MGKQDAGDNFVKKQSDSNNMRDDTARNLAIENQQGATDKAKATDQTKVAQPIDESERKFLQEGSVSNTLNTQLVTLAGVAKQDPQTAMSYPQWAHWLAEQNERNGHGAAAQVMKEQATKAEEVITAANNNVA